MLSKNAQIKVLRFLGVEEERIEEMMSDGEFDVKLPDARLITKEEERGLRKKWYNRGKNEQLPTT